MQLSWFLHTEADSNYTSYSIHDEYTSYRRSILTFIHCPLSTTSVSLLNSAFECQRMSQTLLRAYESTQEVAAQSKPNCSQQVIPRMNSRYLITQYIGPTKSVRSPREGLVFSKCHNEITTRFCRHCAMPVVRTRASA